jgi:hypothetical protein
MHLIDFRLAWTRPYRGLRWWYDAGKPANDPCLALITDVVCHLDGTTLR